MRLLEYIELCNMRAKPEVERAKLLCFYHHKETGGTQFSTSQITELLVDAGFGRPNGSRLRDNMVREKIMKPKRDASILEFVPAALQQCEEEFGAYWIDDDTVPSKSELLDEAKFCGKRGYLDRLVRQINASYKNNCYDACAVLMRRLLEVVLILAYQWLHIDHEIRNADGSYYLLDNILKNAVSNTTLNLSRIKKDFDRFRKVGNFSAHRIEYTADKKDIDDIYFDYRTALEELFYKSGLIK